MILRSFLIRESRINVAGTFLLNLSVNSSSDALNVCDVNIEAKSGAQFAAALWPENMSKISADTGQREFH